VKTINRRNLGFSALEILIVVSIIGILAGVAIPSYKKYITKAQYMEGVTLLQDCMKKVQADYLTNGAFPNAVCGASQGVTITVNSGSVASLFYGIFGNVANLAVIFKTSIIPTGNAELDIVGKYSSISDSFITLCGRRSSTYFTGGNMSLLPASCSNLDAYNNILAL
jgi:prepilin-type N-terminal cleavage/methylation domain-containing protein